LSGVGAAEEVGGFAFGGVVEDDVGAVFEEEEVAGFGAVDEG
jgi:hypothetical protein